ncbi:hypothetical protein SEA_JEEVES_82 [Mycobacterium phage Jeeves]|uniref:Uncharacterized protein n=1 Tax=Mycobacterium phage Jeeves TaxID=2652402 RepID=A0A5J6T4B9_9CAUD|nr:hypothetical protein KNU75_gp027 [Mycobacterium phage Jeeves]QFG04557.1 hypothetical protein SEA_JEEVES_82 [Mycobacterium phage Jeeves]
MESQVDVPVGNQVFETRIEFYKYKVVITSVKAKGWRSAHRKLAKREGFPHLWITHIEHDPHRGGGVVTTQWEN